MVFPWLEYVSEGGGGTRARSARGIDWAREGRGTRPRSARVFESVRGEGAKRPSICVRDVGEEQVWSWDAEGRKLDIKAWGASYVHNSSQRIFQYLCHSLLSASHDHQSFHRFRANLYCTDKVEACASMPSCWKWRAFFFQTILPTAVGYGGDFFKWPLRWVVRNAWYF